MIYNIEHKCPANDFRMDYTRASRLPGSRFDESIGITSIKLKLENKIPCGIYRLNTNFGKATLFVSLQSPYKGYLNFPQSILSNDTSNKSINETDVFDLWNIVRINDTNNDFIATYNRGCC
jgi:hypothetical protein